MLALHRFLIRLSSAAVAAFIWVFIFEYSATLVDLPHALISTALLYALSETTTILLTPFALRRLRGGMRRGLVYGTLLLFAAWALLGTLFLGLFPHGLVAVALLLGAYRALYRVPYSVEYATIARRRAPQLFVALLLAAVPLGAGALLAAGALPAELFFIAALAALLGLLPIGFIRNVHENFSWGYRETFDHFASPEHRRVLLVSVSKGIQGALLFLVWPIVLLFLFAGSPIPMGAAFSATLLLIVLFRAWRWPGRHRRAYIEDQPDGGAYLDEYTALKEMGQALGRLVLAFALVLGFSLL